MQASKGENPDLARMRDHTRALCTTVIQHSLGRYKMNYMKTRTLLSAWALGASMLASTAMAAPAANSRVWVEFAPGKGADIERALKANGGQMHHRFEQLHAFAVTLPTSALNGLRNNPSVVSIEEDAKRYPMAQSVPYGIDSVQARDVWDANRDAIIDSGAPTGAGRMVCIIDSGIYSAHEDFAGVNLVGGYPADWGTDLCGHGTHVAGTIAAANNNLGVVGVTPGTTSLYFVKVFGDDCSWTYSSDLVDAANRCEAAGANVISMSLGGSSKSRAEDVAFQRLYDNGILSIAAAGNDGNTRNSYPASYSSVMSVAAVDENNVVASFSQQNSAVEIAAPGVSVLSTVPYLATNTLSVGGTTYSGGQIEFALLGTATGAVANGGLCDSVGAWSGKVVMCERGTISFFDKVVNVQNGGGVAAVLYNNVAGGFSGTLGAGNTSTIPAISLSQADGQAIVANSLGLSGDVVSSLTKPASGYDHFDGTSMATPHVSAVAALVWSSDTTRSNVDIRNALTQTALDLGAAGRDNAYGYGLVQAHSAWQFLGGAGGGNIPPTASFSNSCTLLGCSFDASASGDADGSITSYAWDFGDGSSAVGVTASHSYAASGTYTVTLTVTDDLNATTSASKNLSVSDGTGDVTAPVISAVSSANLKGNSFSISWTTDEASTTEVTLTCCGTFTDTTLVTQHSKTFNGSKKALYEYSVSSTDAAGNKSTAGPFLHQND